MLFTSVLTSVLAIDCTGSICGCHNSYCFNWHEGVDRLAAYTFCKQPSDCLKGCIEQRCHVLGASTVVPTSIQCTKTSDCLQPFESLEQANEYASKQPRTNIFQ